MAVDVDDLMLIADKLAKDFSFYQNKKIFVTGGTGFFGKWLLESFIYLNNNHYLNTSLTILSRSPEKFAKDYPHLVNHEYFNFIQGDVRDLSDHNESYDLIIHAATDASADLNTSNPDLMRSTIMDGAKAVCSLAKRANCHRVLYTSSGAAYGSQPEEMTSMLETFENNILFNHNDAYASAKLESEQYFQEHTSCDIIIARCFSFSGPYLPLDGSYAFGNFINDILNKRNIIIKGTGTAVRSYLYAADLVIWLLKILALGVDRELYNVGSAEPVNIFELANKIVNHTGNKNNIEVVCLGDESEKFNVYVPSVSKIKKELNVEQFISLESAIIKTVKFNQS